MSCVPGTPPPRSPSVANFFFGGCFELEDGGGTAGVLVGNCGTGAASPRVRPPLYVTAADLVEGAASGSCASSSSSSAPAAPSSSEV